MTPLDDVRNDLLRLALRMLRQAEDEDCQPKYDLSASLFVVTAAIDEHQLEQLASVLNKFAESAGMRMRGTATDN